MNSVEEKISHDEMLATVFVVERARHFTRLNKPAKKLVLDVVDYYLDLYFAQDVEAALILQGIRSQPDEQAMVDLYKQFLEFLPVRLRAGIQGRYLYQEPSMSEKELNAERLIARDLGAEKREESAIMQELGLDEKGMDKLKQLTNLASSDEADPDEAIRLMSEMTGVSIEEVAEMMNG